jgi:hypothetical protein
MAAPQTASTAGDEAPIGAPQLAQRPRLIT